MRKKVKALIKKYRSPSTRIHKAEIKNRQLFAILPVLPQLVIIALCIGVYYAMPYFPFQWGIYIYFGVRIIAAFAILSAAIRSLTVPLAALTVGLIVLFTTNIAVSSLMSPDTAWQLIIVAIIGILITGFMRFIK